MSTPFEKMEQSLQNYFAVKAQSASKSASRLNLHPAQQRVRNEAKRFNVMVMGRRWGKSMMECDLLVEPASQGFPTGYFAPTYKMLAEGWRELLIATEHIRTGKSEQEHRIETINGGVIECWSLDGEGSGSELSKKKYKAGRSRKYKRVCIDEAGLIPNLEEVFNYAIAPTLIDLRGDAWFGGTPNGKGGFFRFYLKGQHRADNVYAESDWMSWQMPTSSNPYIPVDEIERAKKSYPDHVFRQEYCAEFLEDSGQVFRNIHACTRPAKDQIHAVTGQFIKGIWQTKAEPFHVYIISWDLAKKNDFSVLGVIDCTTKSLVHIDCFNQVEYMNQIPRLIALAEKFQPVEVVVEENGNLALMELLRVVKYQKKGPPPRYYRDRRDEFNEFTDEQLMLAEAALARMHDLTQSSQTHPSTMPISEFKVSNVSKEEAIQALVLAFERGEITIPDDTTLLSELEEFGMERLPSGRFRYSAPEGRHDDHVMMLAEGWYRARRYMTIEALPLREKAIRRLSPELKPDNIQNCTSESAYVSQEYWINSFERKTKEKEGGNFLKKLSQLGR